MSSNNVMRRVDTGYSLRQGNFRTVSIQNNLIRASRSGVAVNVFNPLTRFIIANNEIYVDGSPTFGSGIFVELLNGLNVGRCRFDDNHISVIQSRYGIYLNSSEKVGLNSNEVSLEFPMANFGIQLDYTDRSNLFCNLVEGTGADDFQAGLTFSTSSLNTLSCNTIETTGRGIHYLGENVPTTMRGNEFYSHNRALQYGWPSGSFPIGAQTGAQTGIQSHHGNRWLGVYQSGDFGVGHYGTGFQLQNSIIRYDPNDEPNPQVETLRTTEDPAQVGSIFQSVSGDTYLCSSETLGCPPTTSGFTDGITSLYLNTARGRIDPGYFSEPQKWVAKRQLYRRLLDDPALLSTDTLIANFYQEESSTSVGIYESLRKEIGELFMVSTDDESQLEAGQDTILARMVQLQIAEELLAGNPSPQEKQNLLSAKQNLSQEILSETDSYSTINSTLEDQRITNATQILSANANAPENMDFEKYQRTVNRVMLENIIYRQAALTDSQIIALTPIANTCPFMGGPAVYQARALLGDGAAYNDDSLCYVAPQPLRKPKQPDQAIDFRIFPNPSNGYTVLELGQQLEEDGEVLLNNAIGIQFYRQKVNKGDQTVYLIFDEIPTGIYYLTLHTSSASTTKIFTNIK